MRRLLLVGRTGVGKSSFVNAAFGRTVAPTNGYEPCTAIPEYHAHATPFGPICLIDTPGLGEDRDRDEAHLLLMREQGDLTGIDTVLYVSSLADTRFRPEERQTLKRLVEWLGCVRWRQAWLVLTFAARVPVNRSKEQTRQRHQKIDGYLRDLLPCGVFDGFQRLVLIDNVVNPWHPDAMRIDRVLCGAEA